MTLAMTKILTKGLYGEACKGMITTHFSLYCIKVELVHGGMGGGSGAHEWHPVEFPNEVEPVDPCDDTKFVRITVTLDGEKRVKEYQVGKNRARVMLRVINVVNNTREAIDITVKNVKRVATKAVVTIKNTIRRR